MNKIEKEIKDCFKNDTGIALENSPQILDDYLYIEFDNDLVGAVKYRIPYPLDKNHFVNMDKAERVLFILTMMVRMEFGEEVD